MICTKCGLDNPVGSTYCENCGAALSTAPANKEVDEKEELFQSELVIDTEPKAQPVHSKQLLSPGIIQGADGILRWAYEMNMWKNPTLVITIWKVLLLAAMVPALLSFFLSLGDGIVAALSVFIQIAALVVGIVTGLMLLAYPLIALIYGGKYYVVFEMDDKSFKHIQMQKQFNKSQVIAMITVIAGLMTGDSQTTGVGMLAGSKKSMLSSFAKVKKIVVHEKRNVIYVNEQFSRNQIYADPADFAFVIEHIISRCTKAKVTIR